MAASGGGVAAAPRFVGREADVERVCAEIAAAVAGSGRLVLITGEAGIGKTTLAEIAAARARDGGMAVRTGRAPAGVGAPAYWPWLQIVRAHLSDIPAERLRDELGAAASEILRAIPELATLLPGAAPSESPEGEQARFRLFDAIAGFLSRAAAARPLLLVLDDLHWADAGTLLLLRFCARELSGHPVAMIGAFRDLDVDLDSTTGRILEDLAQDAHTVALQGLPLDDVRELLASVAGPHESQRLAHDVLRRSGGNPLFVRELMRLVRAGGSTGPPTVPHSVRAILARRLERLDGSVLDVLTTAAVIGEEFALDVLSAAHGTDPAALLGPLASAAEGRIVADSGPPSSRGRFTHALVRDVLYERLPPAERAERHLRVARALEDLDAGRSGAQRYAEIAEHYLRAVPAADAATGAHYAALAGEQAAAQLAYEDAAAHFRRALQARDREEPDPVVQAGLLIGLGDAELRSGDLPSARTSFVEAAALARGAQRPDLLARAALGLGAGLDGFEVRQFDETQIHLLEEALESLPPDDSSLRVWTTARLSVALTFTESAERRLQAAEEALAMARRVDDAAALAYALGAHCDAIAGPDHSEERLAHASEIVALARRAGDRGMELLGRRLRFMALLELGDLRAVDEEIGAYERVADAIAQPLYQWYVPLWRGMRALMDARPEDARGLARRAAEIGRRADSHNAALLSQVLEWASLLEEGRYGESAAVLREQIKLAGGIYADPLWPAIVEAADRPAEARAAIDRLAASGFADIPKDATWLACMGLLADAVPNVGRPDAASELTRQLAPYGRRFAVDGIGAACFGPVARFAGVAALAAGDVAGSIALLEIAVGESRRSGAPLLVAHACAALADALTARAEPPDIEHARALRDEADEIYRTAGIERRRSDAAQTVGESENRFARQGEVWVLSFAGRTSSFRDAKGLADMATLIARQGAEVHVADLIALGEPLDVGPSSADEVLDDAARRDYRRRLAELRETLDEAVEFGNDDAAEAARAELDVVAGELASALGLGGRSRSLGDPAERARKAVTQRIRNAIKRIESSHPQLARHLQVSVRTGSFCSYAPERPMHWRLQ